MRDLPLIGDEFAGYRLLSVLGRGGMSAVYRAENSRLGPMTALKVMAAEQADDLFLSRFLDETKIAAGLNHPNVIPIHDSGASDGLLYIAMRYVMGTDLRRILKERDRLPPETAVFLLSQAARALDAAHSRGLVHRGVKPGNLLLDKAGDDAEPDHVYLTDFGITTRAADYIAPEQVRGLSVLGPADQYSLGCVLYECLTGRVPFERHTNAAIISAHVEEQPTRPTMLRPDLPRAADKVFARVLAKHPGDRYGSCCEFMEAAREALERPQPEPDRYTARPSVGEQSRYRAHTGERRRGRRRAPSRTPRWLVLCAVGALALAAGIVTLVTVTGGGASPVSLSGNETKPSPSVGASTNPSARPSARPSVRASTRPSTGPGTNMGMEAGTGESGPGTLAGVLAAANSSVEGRGLIQPAKCDQYQQNTSGQIICTSPVPGVSEVFYQNYSSLPALYSAYETEVAELDGGTFRQNTRTCGNSGVSYAEFGWNQEEGHPHNFTVTQMASGHVGQIFASGRMACFATRTSHGVSQDIVWTIDNGPALGVAIGSGSPMAVYQLWGSLHHAVLFRGTEMCGTAGRMNMHDIPTGNLKVVPVCPPGVQAVPVSPPA